MPKFTLAQLLGVVTLAAIAAAFFRWNHLAGIMACGALAVIVAILVFIRSDMKAGHPKVATLGALLVLTGCFTSATAEILGSTVAGIFSLSLISIGFILRGWLLRRKKSW